VKREELVSNKQELVVKKECFEWVISGEWVGKKWRVGGL
jgi:hypothetical protein